MTNRSSHLGDEVEARLEDYNRQVKEIVEIGQSDEEPAVKSQKLLECIAVSIVNLSHKVDILQDEVDAIGDAMRESD